MEAIYEVKFTIDGNVEFEKDIIVSDSDISIIKAGMLAAVDKIHSNCATEISNAFARH